MIETLKQWAMAQGDQLRVIPIHRLQDIKSELADFFENEELNSFQKWIVNDMYKFDLPEVGFTIRSIILIAIPHPFYASVEFTRHAKKYNSLSLVVSDFDKIAKELGEFLGTTDHHLRSAINLPLKRLAAKSGLAVYGRNNICYVEGIGSVFSLAAYFSDVYGDDQDWTEIRQAERCTQCWACANNCPTGAIRKDRFLINNEICLSNLNESVGDFPAWLPESAHHCLYDCLKCQILCPMNKEYVNNTIGLIQFSEDETELLLSGSPLEAFPCALRQKTKMLGLDQWIENIPRNLKVLFELADRATQRG